MTSGTFGLDPEDSLLRCRICPPDYNGPIYHSSRGSALNIKHWTFMWAIEWLTGGDSDEGLAAIERLSIEQRALLTKYVENLPA